MASMESKHTRAATRVDDKAALHTAARRYCYDRLPALAPASAERVYRDQAARQLWDETEGVTAQWEVIPAILFEIEQVSPEEFPTIEVLRTYLMHIGQTAVREDNIDDREAGEGEDVFDLDVIEAATDEDLLADLFPDDEDDTENPEDVAQEIAQERLLFCRYVQNLSGEDLRSVQPLFYRRILTEEETHQLRQRVFQRWKISPEEFSWWPIVGETAPSNVLAFNDFEFSEHVPLEALRAVLAEHGARRIYALDEDGNHNYEIDVDAFVPLRESAGEQYYTSEHLAWVIYLSHEDSITIAGEPVLQFVQEVWPDWSEYLRTTHLPPFVPGLRGRTWYRTRIGLRGTPRRVFKEAVPALTAALQHQRNVRNPRAWWDEEEQQAVVELEHQGATGEEASQVVDNALSTAVDAAVHGWKSYLPQVVDTEEIL